MKISIKNTNVLFNTEKTTIVAQGTKIKTGTEGGDFIVMNIQIVAGKTYYVENTNTEIGVISSNMCTLNSSTLTDVKENLGNESIGPNSLATIHPQQNAEYLRFYVQYQSGQSVGYKIYY